MSTGAEKDMAGEAESVAEPTVPAQSGGEADERAGNSATESAAAESGAAASPEQADAAESCAAESEQTAAEPGVVVPAQAAAEPVAPAPAPRRPGRRELTVTVLIALLGGVIAWAAAGRPWATATVGDAPNTLKVAASGNDLSAGVTALGLTALAGGLALFATQRMARRLVGVLLVAAGVGAAVYAFGERGSGHAVHVLAEKASAKGFAAGSIHAQMASWWVVSALGGVLVVVAGVAAIVRGATWPGMSSRYENAATGTAAARVVDTGSSKDLWDALDRGEDPTEAAVPASATPGAEH